MRTHRIHLLSAMLVCFSLLFTACNKEEIMHHEQAGAWKIKSIETTWYDAGNVDSTGTTHDAGVLQLWDNHSENNNVAEFEFTQDPPSSIYDVADAAAGLDPQAGVCWWHAGPGSNDRLTLWFDTPGVDKFVIYTVTEIKRRTMTLTYVRVDSEGRMSLKEVWQLESY